MTIEIRAAVVREPRGPFVTETLRLRAPEADEVVVRLVASGVCHTDAIVRNGDYPVPFPVVLGHEGAGIVEAVGPDVHCLAPGDHVILSFVSCGVCSTCAAGRPALCQSAFELNFLGSWQQGAPAAHDVNGDEVGAGFFGQSSFADHLLAPASCVVKVDDDLDLTLAAPLGCGIQTGAGAVLNSLRPPAGSTIAVFGAGAVGLSAVMAAVIAGCSTIVAVDLQESRLQLALELGATHVVDPTSAPVVDTVRALTGGGVEFALDTTGNPAVVRQAIESLRIAGTFGLIGASKTGTEVSLDLTHMLFGRTFRGIIEGDSVPREFIPELIRHHRSGRFPFDRLVQHFALDELEEAVSASERGTVVKPVIRF